MDRRLVVTLIILALCVVGTVISVLRLLMLLNMI